MKLIAKLTDGKEVELDKIISIDKNCKTLLLRLKNLMKKDEIEKVEKELSKKIGMKVILLPCFVDEIIAIE